MTRDEFKQLKVPVTKTPVALIFSPPLYLVRS